MTTPVSAQVHVLYGSETGNAEFLCDDLVDALAAREVTAVITALDEVPVDELVAFDPALIIISTTGDGDPPHGAEEFYDALDAGDVDGTGLRYAVLALGDSTYAYFCDAGVSVDERLAEIGAVRLADRVDCDAAYDKQAAAWIAERAEQLAAIVAGRHGGSAVAVEVGPAAEARGDRRATRENSASVRVLSTEILVAGDAAPGVKQVIRCDLADGGITWQPGDSVGVIPVNDADTVRAFLRAAGCGGEELVEGRTLADRARDEWELRFPPVPLMEAAGLRGPEQMAAWARTHTVAETIAAIAERTADRPGPRGLAELMRPIRARAYSIAGSVGETGEGITLAVAVERPDAPTLRTGVAGGYLAGLPAGAEVRIFPMPNRSFRLPDDPATPIIMVGAGVGVAPYRAFLAERDGTSGAGPAWLIAGHRYRDLDFLYAAEWQRHVEGGTLTSLDTAFSRDGAHRVYVQHRLRARGADLARWLADGAVLYVCGDADAMAPAVEQTVREVLVDRLGKSRGRTLFEQLRVTGRYRTDIY